MRIFRDFDELKAAVGTEVGVSDWIDVTQERIDQFARATGDDQWVHVDVERAERELPTGTTIAHGLLTLSFAPVFVRSVIDLEGLKNTLNYGANRIRYLAPVPAGARSAAAMPSRPRSVRPATACGSRMASPSKSRATGVLPAWPSSLPCISDE
jgi:acyl dehydratase